MSLNVQIVKPTETNAIVIMGFIVKIAFIWTAMLQDDITIPDIQDGI